VERQNTLLTSDQYIDQRAILTAEIRLLLTDLGKGKIDGVAYDTAWVARLAPHYPGFGFEASLEWLRRNQYDDGTWGGPLVQYHDRFISTLAAVVALREVGGDSRDERRVKRGEDALWRLVGRLGRDDSDTIGFPILAASLGQEARSLGLDVPQPPVRFAAAYRMKVQALLNQPERNWVHNTLTYSLEGLRSAVTETDRVLEANASAASSPAATAAYLLMQRRDDALAYLQSIMEPDGSGAVPTFSPIDIFDVIWPLNHLHLAGAIEADDPDARLALERTWRFWSPETGIGTSTFFSVPDMDDTAACFAALKRAGFPVSADVFRYYELDDHFCCYHGETNPALSAHVRLLAALRLCEDHPYYQRWIDKVVNVLRHFDENGSFWWDKWHSSPYYVNGAAIQALHGVADDLMGSRFRWILRTQNDDGGWGYLGESTPEETAYCLEALLYWDRHVARVEPSVLDAAARYLAQHLNDRYYVPLWIGKCLYTPRNPVRAAILSALFSYSQS